MAALLLLLGVSMSAQVRVSVGIAAGRQSYEQSDLDSRPLLSPELSLSRDRLALYYALDTADLSSSSIRRGRMFASHLGVAYGWPAGKAVVIRVGAGPSYVTVAKLGGEPTWHAQVEVALRRSRLEWFAKLRHCGYALSGFHIADASPDGPALLAGVRVALNK